MKFYGFIFVLFLFSVSLHAQTTTTTYDYDALGNRTQATNLIRPSTVQLSGFSPVAGVHGDPVNILGRNLPANDATGITIDFDGVAGNIVSVASNVLTVEVPPGAATGPLTVTLPGESPLNVGTFFVEGLNLAPTDSRILFSQNIQFAATVIGAVDQSVTWDVVVPFGADPSGDPGDITVDGLYTPPANNDPLALPEAFVRATSVELPEVSSLARISLFGLTRAVSVTQAIVAQPDSVATVAAKTSVNLVVPDPNDVAHPLPVISSADPPVTIVIIGTGPVGIPMIHLAQPPVEVDFEDE